MAGHVTRKFHPCVDFETVLLFLYFLAFGATCSGWVLGTGELGIWSSGHKPLRPCGYAAKDVTGRSVD